MSLTATPPQLAVRLPNWVGDVVMALPTLLELERAGFVLRTVGQTWAQDLLAGMRIDVTPVPRGVLATSRALRRLRARRGLLFTNSMSSAAAMRLAGIEAVGYRADCRGLLLHQGIKKPRGLHEVEYFWRLGAAVSACWNPGHRVWPAAPPPSIYLRLSNEHHASAALALRRSGIRGSYIAFCPMAIGENRRGSKKWPLFSEMCRSLVASGQQVVSCPGPGEEPACHAALPGAVIIPGLSLGCYAAILQGAQRVMANDSGPMHLATAVGTPVLGVFGAGNAARTRPWGGHYVGGNPSWPSLSEVRAAFESLPQRRAA